MSAVAQFAANDLDALDPCWVHVAVAASSALSTIGRERSPDREAQETIEGGPVEPAEVPGGPH